MLFRKRSVYAGPTVGTKTEEVTIASGHPPA